MGQQNENIVIVNTESFPILGDSIPDLIKSFGVDLVICLYSRLKEDDVNFSPFFLSESSKRAASRVAQFCAQGIRKRMGRVFTHHPIYRRSKSFLILSDRDPWSFGC